MKFTKYIRHFKHRAIRTSTQLSLTSATTIPDSGFTFLNNSQGASAALSEFSTALDFALEHFDFEAELADDPIKAQLQRLDEAAGEYSNSSVNSRFQLQDWHCSKENAQLVAAAFKCAAAVYDPGAQPQAEGIKFKLRDSLKSSLTGTAKALSFWDIELESQDMSGFEHDRKPPVVVVAIRGSASLVDQMVNANGQPLDAGMYFTEDEMKVLRNGSSGTHISQLAKQDGKKHIIFTGHSAGGAVASLLFTKFLLGAAKSRHSPSFSYISFGSPPVISPNITPILTVSESLTSSRGFILAIVNEFDLVPRADQAYIRTLIDLYRSTYDREPMMNDAIEQENVGHLDQHGGLTSFRYVLPPLVFENGTNTDTSDGEDEEQENYWKLPIPDYHLVGDIVLLKKETVVSTVQETKMNETLRPQKMLRALSVPHGDFERLLFCGIETHSRTSYGMRIDRISQGCFNNRHGWETA